MQLYIVRHAQSVNNEIWSRTGSSEGRLSDPDITEIGREQAKLVAAFLAHKGPKLDTDYWDSHNRIGFDLTHLYSSYMLRAVATGTYISEATGLPLVAWEDIHEWGGIYNNDPETGGRILLPGSNRAFFAERFPDFVVHETLGEEGWWNYRPYEAPPETLKRAARFLNELLARHSDEDRVAIVTHGGFADGVAKILLGYWPVFSMVDEGFDRDGIPAELQTNVPQEMWFRLNNVSVSRIDIFRERFVFVYWNRVDFLPGEMIT